MSTSIIVDTMTATEVQRDERGWYAMRSALIIGLTGNPSAIVYNGVQDTLLTANNYNFGQAHPTMTALYCCKTSGKAVDRDKVEILSEYRPYPALINASTTQAGVINFACSVQSVTTNIDITGATLSAVAPTGISGSPISGTTNVEAPVTVLTIRRKEPSIPPVSALNLINCVNQFSHNIATVNFPPYTLKLERINTELSDNGNGTDAYIVTYEFCYRPLIPSGTFSGYSAWQTFISYTDSSGNVPKTVSLSDGSLAVYWNYYAADFSTLYLW